MIDCIDVLHNVAHGAIDNFIGRVGCEFWKLFSIINGNPDLGNYGVRYSLAIFFSFMLIIMLQLRAKMTLDKHHIVAFIGSILLLFRYTFLMGFEWGYQVGLYNDWLIHFLFPPLEHFFYSAFFFCMAYYSLNSFEYYPGLLKRLLWYIPTFLTGFFMYASFIWKKDFMEGLPAITQYWASPVDWQSHLVMLIMISYTLVVAMIRHKKNQLFLVMFWIIVFIENLVRVIIYYDGYTPSELITMLNAISLWSIPLLVLHFACGYIVRLGFPQERRSHHIRQFPCPDCPRPEDRVEYLVRIDKKA